MLTVLTTLVAAQGPAFDVVSIKANNSGNVQRNVNHAEGGHFMAVNVALGDLIRVSHGVRPAGQVYSELENGGVSWLYAEHFDIRATTGSQPSRPQLLAMLRAMLIERFHLRVHSVTHEETVFELRLARDDGRLGPGLRPSTVACGGSGAQCSLTNLPGTITGTSVPIEALAHMISGWVDGHVEVRDRTGLSGRFVVDLKWTPTQASRQLPDGVVVPPVDPDGASLPTAIREQLGLRLVRTQVDVPVLVVDGADKPSPD
jgi:uncharacterized protein (TIGR03435 family)